MDSDQAGDPNDLHGLKLIAGIWNNGRGRYGIEEPTKIKLFDHPPFEEVIKRGAYDGKGIKGV